MIEAAIEIGSYLIEHARFAYRQMGADPVVADAKFILRWVKNFGLREFQKRELHQANRARFKTLESLGCALRVLIQLGFIREKTLEPLCGPGRKSSPEYEVNPLWLKARNTQNAQKARGSSNSENSEDCELNQGTEQ